ncbi:N-acetylmuramoyl-L-alanine amidase [Blautia sp. JLR.GB0024]|uniref:N-acetylmuramoyl-L-alanine amidase family protein n=1 Tax=Blautia sp. JLR.GB0024 TaxID=3123295 RepID=UPI003005967E
MKAKAVIVWCFAIILLLSGGILFKINYQIYKKTQTKVEKIENRIADMEKQTNKNNNKLEDVHKSGVQKEQSEEQTKAAGKKIALDPGHQSENVDMSDLEPIGPGASEMKAKASTGTVGNTTGKPEYELNLEISRRLYQELQTRGYEVVMTREDNETAISNKERAELAVREKADIFLRIHANSSENPGIQGAMTMVPSEENPYVGELSAESSRLGQCIIDSYCETTGMLNKGVQYYDDMTGINWSQIPVTIIEMGFMSNAEDDTNMADLEYQSLMVQGIADGIDDYFGNVRE